MSWGTEGWGLVAIGAFMAFVANIFYMWGGTEGFNKVWRRYIGATILASSANLLAILMGLWAWPYLLFYPCLMIGFSLGYGGDNIPYKIFRRSLYALAILMSCVIGAWVASWSIASFLVMGLAVITGLTSVALGVFNPFNSARVEEFMVSQVLTLYIPFWAYVTRNT